MFELSAGSLAYNILKDALNYLRGRKRRLSPEKIIELRQRWKPLFEEEIHKNLKNRLRQDVVIRDVRRLDKYPDLDIVKRGVSPWFRLGLVDIYHRGIVVVLNYEAIYQDNSGNWHTGKNPEDANEGVTAALAARIPFENIESVDWDGDEYYNYPHIYCHFSNRKTPYEGIGYYREIKNPNTRSHFTEIVNVEQVQRGPKKRRFRWLAAKT